MKVAVISDLFDPWQEFEHYQKNLPSGQYGATAAFIGTMRDFNEDTEVQSMKLDHYPGMTEKHLEEICLQAIERWQLVDALIVHRTGELFPDDPIVLVAAWSAHRNEAFEACRFMIEDLKHKAPFWKKEMTNSGHRWVEKNTPS